MLNEKQKEAVKLMGWGLSRAEVARRVRVKPQTLRNWQAEEEFRTWMEIGGEVPGTEVERLKKECELAVMKELKRRLKSQGICEIEGKELLAIADRVGKAADESAMNNERSTMNNERQQKQITEESLVGRLSDETRKRIYELLNGESEGGAEKDASEGCEGTGGVRGVPPGTEGGEAGEVRGT